MSGANDCPRCGADMVLPERVCIICLTAENARLRGEVEQATRVYQEALGCIEWDGERIATLTADLARVTGERDGLKMFADGVAEGDCHYGDACPTFGSRHGKCVVCQAREALAACAPPASGEEG